MHRQLQGKKKIPFFALPASSAFVFITARNRLHPGSGVKSTCRTASAHPHRLANCALCRAPERQVQRGKMMMSATLPGQGSLATCSLLCLILVHRSIHTARLPSRLWRLHNAGVLKRIQIRALWHCLDIRWCCPCNEISETASKQTYR